MDETITTLGAALRATLLALAKEQEDLAASIAASVPYWAPCPTTVLGCRAAAAALRHRADTAILATT